MEEPESNFLKEQAEEKGIGSSPKSKFSDKEVLENELREAIRKMTGRGKGRNKSTDPDVE